MSILFTVLIGLGGLIVLLLLIALFTKKNYTVKREIVVNQPVAMVFDYVSKLKNQEFYNTWTMMDPNVKREYAGIDGTVGFTVKWESDVKQVGIGEQEIKNIKELRRVDSELRFIKPFPGVAQAEMSTEPLADNKTQVISKFDSSMKYPMNIMLWFMNMDEMLGKELHKSLQNLKHNLEK